MKNLNELGVGLVYFQGFERFLESHSSLIDIVEIEPQTFWYDKNDECASFKFDEAVTGFLQHYPRPKLFHGVGYPVGGTWLAPQAHFNTLRQQAETLQPEWISEHLSFNIFTEYGADVNSGFLLPPLQSSAGIATAVANIQHYRAAMDRPFAFETGVNYLQPRKNEIPDGLFTAKIAEQADCHILLDLHNILTNQRNGRQSVKDFVNSLPLERVIELHVGGGIYYKDYYLDAHSGPSDDELFGILDDVAGMLPNLKALMFEINPDYLVKVPEAAITEQLIKMHRIWDKRGRLLKKSIKPAPENTPSFNESLSVPEWETTLGNLVLGRVPQFAASPVQEPTPVLTDELIQDPGITIIKDLIFNFRGSVLVTVLKLSTRLLRLSVGEAAFNTCINNFFASAVPELLPVIVATQFFEYVKANQLMGPRLQKVLEYEIAAIHTAIDQQPRTVSFDFDPLPLLAALQDARLPGGPVVKRPVNLQIVSDQAVVTHEQLNFSPVFHV